MHLSTGSFIPHPQNCREQPRELLTIRHAHAVPAPRAAGPLIVSVVCGAELPLLIQRDEREISPGFGLGTHESP